MEERELLRAVDDVEGEAAGVVAGDAAGDAGGFGVDGRGEVMLPGGFSGGGEGELRWVLMWMGRRRRMVAGRWGGFTAC